MADPREFVLIGRFDDGITPQLAKINNQLAQLKQTFSNIGGKGARGAARDLGKFNAAVEGLSNTLKIQNKVLKGTIEPMRQYRREAGKTVGALKKLDEVGGRSVSIERTNKALKEQIRLMDQLRGRSALSQRGGGYSPPVPPPRSSRGGRGGGGMPPVPSGGSGGGYAAAVGGGILGNQVANLMTNAIVRGFEIGTSIMVKPFQYFQGAFGERVRDELDDLKAAGGFFSIAKRQQDPFVKSIDEAIQFQQDNNRVFAKMAAALPGVTNDYVQVSKRVGDTIARVVNNDLPKAIEEANKIRATEEGRRFYGDRIQGTGPEAVQQTMTTLIGDLTKQTVLAGLGGRAGAGGMMGAYGLPGLAERMISQEEVSMGQFQRYAAVFGDPMIADALSRNIAKINATQKDSVERLNALRDMFKEILTPEMIDKLRTSFDGVYQSLRSAIIDPDTGIIGLGRQLKGLGKRVNSFGQYVDKAGKVVEDINMAADIDLSLFEMLRDIFVQTGQVLSPIVEFLPEMWDPLKKIGEAMKEARHYTAEFARTFNEYREGLKAYAKTLGGAAERDLMGTLDLRASLAAINNLFAEFGVYGKDTEKMFSDIAKKLKDPKANLGEIASSFIETFFSSDIAKKIGETIGTLIGTVLRQVADATKYVANVVEGGGFGGGFASGFQKAGGFSAIQDIFMSITQLFIKALITAITKMPLLSLTVTGLLALPAIIGAGITQLVEMAFARCSGMMGSCPVPGGGKGSKGSRGYDGGLLGEQRSTRAFRLRKARQMRDLGRGAQRNAEPFVNYAKTSRLGQGAGRLAKGARGLARGVGRVVPGGALAGGAIDMGIALATGEDFGKAAAGAIGTVLGGTVGSVFGPVGTMIGMAAGGMIGDATADAITRITAKGPSVEQLHAAEMQNEAAVKQLQAARLQKGGLTEDKATYTFGTAEQFADRLKVLGLDADKAGAALKNLYGKREGAATAAEKAAKELNEKIKDLKDNKVPPDLIAKQVKPLQEQFNKAKANLEKAQADFDAQFRKTPEVIQRSITNSLSALSFKNIETILGNKISQIRAPQYGIAPGALTVPPPADADKVNIPTFGDNIGGSLFDRNAGARYKGGLGDAIASEMRMKPPGSDLVIANSSETVIPAAGGYGMKDFMGILSAGFTAINNQYKSLAMGVNTLEQDTGKKFQQSETQNADRYQKTTSAISNYHKENQQEFAKIGENILQLSQKVATMSSMGGLFGGGMGLGGGYGGAGVQIAGQLGNYIKQTGGAPGSIHEHPAHGGVKGKHAPGSYHYSGRAIDIGAYANEQAGVIARIQAFNAKMGVKPVEFLHAGNDPNHQDHVHVAYAFGQGRPAFFDSQSAAERWERSMVSGSVRVGSVTGNSSEGFGATINGGINVTVNAGATNDPDQLAYMVAVKIQEAVGDAVNSNILV